MKTQDQKPTRQKLTFIESEMSESPFIRVMQADKQLGAIHRSWDADNNKPVYTVEDENGTKKFISGLTLQDIKRGFIQHSKEIFNSIIPEPPVITGQESLEDLKPAISRELKARVKTIENARRAKSKTKNKSKGLNR